MRRPTLSKSRPCFWIELLTKYLIEEKCCFFENKTVPNYSTLLCKVQYFVLHFFLSLNHTIGIFDRHSKQFSNRDSNLIYYFLTPVLSFNLLFFFFLSFFLPNLFLNLLLLISKFFVFTYFIFCSSVLSSSLFSTSVNNFFLSQMFSS